MSYTITHSSRQHKSGFHIISDCPYCGKGNHFYLNIKTGKWDCKKCGEAGNYNKYAEFINKGGLDGIKLLIQNNFDLSKVENVFDIKTDNENYFPTSFVPLKQGDKFYKYFTKTRRFSQELIDQYAVFTTQPYDDNYFNRIVVPIPDDKGVIRGYVGRAIFETMKKRYYNSKGTKFSELLFNYKKVKNNNNDFVIVVEGIFDSLRLSECSVATFGKKISEHQLYLLKRLKKNSCILLFDEDASKEILKYGYILKDIFQEVYTCYLPDGDPDKFFTHFTNEKNILNYIIKTSTQLKSDIKTVTNKLVV